MSAATLDNSGTIASEQSVGVLHGSLADLSITNREGGVITGATSGIYGSAGGTLAINNAGTIRGEGTYDGFDAVPDAGVTIGTASSSVINSNDGVRLIGGGSVTNSGAISGRGALGADGISMFRADGQAAEDYAATVANAGGGNIAGDRFGVILSGGGAVENAGSIAGDLSGVVIQSQFNGEDAGLTGTLVNEGTITSANGAGAQFSAGLETIIVDNSGSIGGATVGVAHGTDGAMTLTNSGSINGGQTGVVSEAGGAVTLVNSGSIVGTAGAAFTALTQTSLDNAGTLAGGAGVAVTLSSLDDSVILLSLIHI